MKRLLHFLNPATRPTWTQWAWAIGVAAMYAVSTAIMASAILYLFGR